MNLSFDLPESIVSQAVIQAWERSFSLYSEGRKLIDRSIAQVTESDDMRNTITRIVDEQYEPIARRVIADELEKRLRTLARKAAKNVTLPEQPNLFKP